MSDLVKHTSCVLAHGRWLGLGSAWGCHLPPGRGHQCVCDLWWLSATHGAHIGKSPLMHGRKCHRESTVAQTAEGRQSLLPALLLAIIYLRSWRRLRQ